jgi:uncharacterized protein (TIGR00369 family)
MPQAPALPHPDHAEATLAEWQACAEAFHRIPRHPGVARPEQVAGKTGHQVFQAMLAGELPAAPIAKTLDFFLVHAEPGRAIFQGQPGLAHYNPLGTVHGGWLATLLDSALGCAVHAALPVGKAYTTAELKVNMVRALSAKAPLVRAEAWVVHQGGRMATTEGRLYGPDGKLYAHGSATLFIFDALGTP